VNKLSEVVEQTLAANDMQKAVLVIRFPYYFSITKTTEKIR